MLKQVAINPDGKLALQLQTMFGLSFDKDSQKVFVGLLGYNPTNDSAYMINISDNGRLLTEGQPTDSYGLNDEYESGAVKYLGMESADGKYLIRKIDSSSGKSFRYATVVNNPLVTSYADAWSSKESLSYGTIADAF